MATVIELNGRRYNAATGSALDSAPRSVDGVLSVAPVTPLASRQTAASAQQLNASRLGQHHTKRHPTQHSKTLMRQSVHPPSDGFKRHLRATAHTSVMTKAASFDIVPKRSVDTVDPDRLKRAGHVGRSEYVRRFAANPVSLSRGETTYTPRTGTPYQPAEAKPAPVTPTRQPSDDIFERALATANSHRQPPTAAKRKGKKLRGLRVLTSVTASLLAVVLIIGFVAYQNSAMIQLRLAASKSGLNATAPIWQPSGFRLGSLTATPGKVAISYENASSGQQYTVSESATQWDSNALLNNYVYPNNNSYDTITAGDTTIYTYGNNNATWIDRGIWYKLTSDGSLSTSQIVNVATSMRA